MQGCQSMKLKYTNGLLEVCKVAAAVIRMATDGMAYAPLVQMPDIKCRCDPKRRASSSFPGGCQTAFERPVLVSKIWLLWHQTVLIFAAAPPSPIGGLFVC
jgi:hypothetical protein